jgi:Ni/Co efflux regulator RcnB
MKKILLSIAAVSAVAAAVPAVASAQSYGPDRGPDRYERGPDRGPDRGYGHGGDRVARLDERIDMGIRNGGLNRNEAWRLKGELRETARLQAHYRRGGLSGWERADLDRRFDRISTQIRYERHDRDYGHGYGNGPRRY